MDKRIGVALVCLLIGFGMSACAGRMSTRDADFKYAFEDRYPISRPRIERIDVSGSQPTPQDIERIASFGRSFVRSGTGKIVIFVPETGAGALASGQWVKRELIANGVSATRIQWDARSLPAGLVRVAFSTQTPAGGWSCTNLNEDVQQREDQESYLNRELVNFGCAYQSNMLAQADDPHDFIRPRPEGAADATRLANAVKQRRAQSGSPVGATTP